MKSKRSKHSPALKARVALAAIREQETVAEIARRNKINANLVYKWKKDLLDNLARIFEAEGSRGSVEAPEREANSGTGRGIASNLHAISRPVRRT